MKDEVVPYQELVMQKKQQVALMFDHIAFRYDLMNRLLSFGIDVLWRKKLVKLLKNDNPKVILDVATGTADVAIGLSQLSPDQIIGIDISSEMLGIGRLKVKERNLQSIIRLEKGDAEALPFEDNKFDAVTVAFGVRNFEDLSKGLHELLRVLKKDGKLMILEFSKPNQFPFKQLFRFYFSNICPLLGKWITNEKMAYEYLHRSVTAFPDGNDFLFILKKTGFKETKCRRLTFGISSIYTGKKA